MADLSQDDLNIIAKHPLNDTLEQLRDTLRRIECSYQDEAPPDESDRDSAAKQAISRLLYTLLGHATALHLQSKNGHGDVTSELATVLGPIRRDEFNYEQYRPLAQVVINKTSDVVIWRTVFDLITVISQLTLPASTPSSFESTPATCSSASQHEQTKRLLDPILHDFRECSSIQFPYKASPKDLPEPLPTTDQIENSDDILFERGGAKVVGVGLNFRRQIWIRNKS